MPSGMGGMGGAAGMAGATTPDMALPDATAECLPGFVDGPEGCQDIDECDDDVSPCDPLTRCINVPGDYTCTRCPPGYTGDGRTGCVLACGEGEHDDGAGGCAPVGTCADGFVVDADGDCVPAGCPAGQHDGGDGACVPLGACSPGFVIDEDEGDCVRAPPQMCPEGSHDGGDGTCVPLGSCVFGHRIIDDVCVALSCPEDDAGEPDDQPDDARALDGVVEGIACPADPDVFAVEPGGACRLRIALELGPGTPPMVQVADPRGMRLPVESEGEGAVVAVIDGPVTVIITGEAVVYRLTAELTDHDGGDGTCVPLETCVEGYALDPAGGCTLCAPGFRDGGDGSCVAADRCAPGFHEGGDGTCVAEGTCAPGFRDGGDGSCVGQAEPCVPGFRDGGGGVCVAAGRCAPGFSLDVLDRCRPAVDCPEGSRDDGTGACAPIDVPCAPDHHPGGGEEPACLPIGDCAIGFSDRGDTECVEAGRCLPDRAPDRADNCLGPLMCPFNDGFEPNQLVDEAPSIEPGLIDGILCGADVDVFRFEPPGGCAFRVILRHAIEDGDLSLVVAGEAGGDFQQAATPTDDERLVIAGDAGPYVITVTGANVESIRYGLRIDLDGHDGGDGTCVPLGECSPGHVLELDGRCGGCADGFHDGGTGACVPLGTCSSGFHDGDGDGPGDTCVPEGTCLRGFQDGGQGVCRPEGVCDQFAGFFDRGDGVCVGPGAPCAPGYERDFFDRCVCPIDRQDGGDGQCVERGTCSPGFQSDGTGRCTPLGVCAEEHHYTPWGACRATDPACPAGTIDDGTGRCAPACAPGFRDGGDGACTAPPACALDFHDGGDGDCRPIGACAEGFSPTPDGACLIDSACQDLEAPPFALAPELPLDGRVDGIFCGPDVSALYRLEVPADCGAVVELNHARVERDLDLLLYDFDEALIATEETLADQERMVLAPGPERTLFVRVRPFPPDGEGTGRFSLMFRRDPLRCPGACPDGQRSDGAGGCVGPDAPCAPGFRDDGQGECVPGDRCAAGYHDDGFGHCGPFDRCAPGAVYDLDRGCRPAIECGAGEFDNGLGACADVCAVGHRDDGSGACSAPPICAEGFLDDGAGRCAELAAPGDCPDGFTPDANGLCLAAMCPEFGGDPGDAPQTATPLDLRPGSTTRIDGALCIDDFGDLYAVELRAGCRIGASLRFDHDRRDLSLAILDANGRPRAQADTATDRELIGDWAEVDSSVRVAVQPVRADGLEVLYRLDLRLDCPVVARRR